MDYVLDQTTMESVSQRKFDQALTVMRQLPESIHLSHQDKLKLYGLYKQAVHGICPYYLGKSDKITIQKWNSWRENQELSQVEAQEQYFLSVIQILSKYTQRPHIIEIIESLERGSRIIAIQSLQPKSLSRPDSLTGQCSSERIWIEEKCKTFTPDFNYELLHFNGKPNILQDFSLQPLDYDINSPVDFETSSSEGPEDFSDDGISLSTCTVKAYGKNYLTGSLQQCRYSPSLSSSQEFTSSPPRPTNDSDRALENLQTQVVALNERLERLQRELDQNNNTHNLDPSTWGYSLMRFIRKTFVNMIMSALVTSQIYRNRPIPNFVLLLQLVFPTSSFLKLLFATIKKLIR